MKSINKRGLSLLLSIVLIFTTFMSTVIIDASVSVDTPSSAVPIPGPNLTYTFDESTGKLTISGTGPMYNFRAVNSKVLKTSVAPWSSIKESIKSVVIGEGVTSVGDCSFYGCTNLVTVLLPSTLLEISGSGVTGTTGNTSTNTGSYGAFRECTSLTSINFPIGLETIGIAAFRDCSSLKKITLPDSITRLDRGAFIGCTSVSEVTFGSGVKSLPMELFYNCSNLSVINWNTAIEEIGAWCFYNTRLTSVEIPEHITHISDRAFADCFHLRNAYIYNRDCAIDVSLNYDPFNNSGLTNTQDFCVHGYTGSTAQSFAEAQSYSFEPLDNCSHTNTHTNVIKPATCTEDGIQEIYCDDCETVIKTESISAIGHDYQVVSSTDDTSKDGHIRELQRCSNCKDEKTVVIHAQTDDSTTLIKKYIWVDGYYSYECNANCTQPGWEKYTCTVEGCGVTQRNTVAQTGHTVDNWIVTKQPTCVEEGTKVGHCSVCDQNVTETIEKTGHTIDHDNPIKTVDKTDIDGHIYRTYACSVCGEQTEEIEHVEWIDGKYTPTVLVNVTCTTNGLERDKCDICGETRSVTLQAKGEHTWEVVDVIEPTCTTKGQTNYKCSVCGATKKDDEVAALGHNYVIQSELTVKATCTESGSATYKCSRCSSSKTEVIEPRGHFPTIGTKVVTTEPDCEHDGAGHATCKICGVEYDYVISALGHEYVNEEVPITDKPGHVLSTPVCTREGCNQRDTAQIVHKEWIEGYYTHTVLSQGSCTAGEIYINRCTICNTTTGDVQGSPLGHEYRAIRVYDNPSESTGLGDRLDVEPYSVIYVCKHCVKMDSKTGEFLHNIWSNYYYHIDQISRLPIDYSSYLDVNADGVLNAKDYAIINKLYKKYMQYKEEAQTDSTQTEA